MLILLLLVIAVVTALEVPGLLQKKMWGELAVYGLLLAVGMVLSITEMLDIPLPNPTHFTERLFKPLYILIDRALK